MSGMMRRIGIVAMAVLAGSVAQNVRACTVCYGESESAVILGAQQATVLMVGLTYFLLGGGVAAFVLLRRRSLRDDQQQVDGEGASQ